MVADQVFVDGPPPAVRQQRRHIPCPPLVEFLVVLKQASTSCHIHQLQAATDAERGKVRDPRDERGQHLQDIQPDVGALQLGVRYSRIQARIEVTAARQEQPIEIEYHGPELV